MLFGMGGCSIGDLLESIQRESVGVVTGAIKAWFSLATQERFLENGLDATIDQSIAWNCLFQWSKFKRFNNVKYYCQIIESLNSSQTRTKYSSLYFSMRNRAFRLT